MKKKALSIILALVMVVSMVPFGAILAFAAEEYPIVLDEDEWYGISDKTYTLSWEADRVFEISDGAYVVFTNVTFSNVTGGDGCCVYIDLTDSFSGVEFHNCKFINCESTGNGVVYINNITTPYNSVVFDDCTIENCHSDNGNGGFLYVNDGDADVIFNRTTFKNCSAKCGGVEYIQSSNHPTRFNDCTITDCHASQLGGFVCTNDAEAVVECSNTEISGCSAVDGGAFYMDNGDSFIFENNSRILDCHAEEDGGAIYINDVDGEIHGNGVHSGIIINQNTGTAAIISGCSAEYGGGVYISKGTLAEDLVLADNTATYAGGGMHENSEIDAQCTVRNCRFIHNTAGDNDKNLQSGGGLYVDDGNGYVIGCKFFENLAYKNGADLYSNSYISNCIVVTKGGGGTVSVIVDEEQQPNITFRSWGSYQFDKGAGTENDPYRIENLEDWDTLFFNTEYGLYTDGIYIRLDTDLTVTLSVGLVSSGRYFKGHFDGNGHTVTVIRRGNDENVGAFGHAENATIKNLTVKGTINGNSAVGGIVGSAVNTLIENCTSDATIRASEKAGGIIGLQDSGTVVNNCISDSDSDIRCKNNYAGGISGYIAGESTVIRNCAFLGYVSAAYYHTGGIVGYEGAATTVFNAHSFGMVPGSVAGAISGFSAEGSAYELCLYNKEYCTADAHGIGVSRDALYGKTTDTVGGKEFRMPYFVNDYINENGKAADGWLYMVFTESGMPVFISDDALVALGPDGLLHDYSAYGDVTVLDENTAVLGKHSIFYSEPINKKVYIVNRDIHRTGRIKIYEDVLLIINDGCEYIVDGGIDLENATVADLRGGYAKYVDREANLIVTTKSLGSNMGKLTVKATNPGDAAIGGDGGYVYYRDDMNIIETKNGSGSVLTVYGGNITVNGNCENSVGIGGGSGIPYGVWLGRKSVVSCNADGGSGCTINMYNGTLDVTSGKGAVGIGGGNGYLIDDSSWPTVWNGNGGEGGTFNYYGGTVKVQSDLTAFGRGLKGDGSVVEGSTKINTVRGKTAYVCYGDYSDGDFHVVASEAENDNLSKRHYALITDDYGIMCELTKHKHRYDSIEYVWSDDCATCTATGICSVCQKNTEGHTISVTVDSECTHYAPCRSYEYDTYTAEFDGIFTTQTKNVYNKIFNNHRWESISKEEHHCSYCGITQKHRYRGTCVDNENDGIKSVCTVCGNEMTNVLSNDISYISVEKGAYINTGVEDTFNGVSMTVDVQSSNEYWFGTSVRYVKSGGIDVGDGGASETVEANHEMALTNNGTNLYAIWNPDGALRDSLYYVSTHELLKPGMHTVKLSNTDLIIDGILIDEYPNRVWSTSDMGGRGYSPIYNVLLFAQGIKKCVARDQHSIQSTNYSVYIPENQGTIHCYGCQIVGLLNGYLRYFVPYVNENGEAGLYDLVEGKFYGNDGEDGKITAYCTVSFDMNGHGTQVEPIDIEYGKTLTRPADPTAKGYTFEGWYKDKEGTDPWDFENDTVTASTGLYAKWTKTVLHPDANGKYHIRNAEDWETFDSMVKDGNRFTGETVLLDSDITVTNLVGGFNSNASLSRPFCGTFDGQNHTVTVDFDWDNGSDKGAFSHTNNGAVIKNLTVNGEIKGDYSIGGIVGNASATTFINCTSNVSVTGAYSGNTDHQYAGGIAGYACDGTRFENCVNNATVTGNNCVGGIAGLADSGTVFENCAVYGNVTGNESVGGIVGRVSTNKRGNYVSTLLNCIASGSVTGSTYSGGIVGCENGPVSVKNAHFFGSVSASSNVAGITGSANGGSYYENCLYNENCPADAHGTGLDIADIPDAANDYIVDNDKTAEAWRYIGFDENGKPVFIDCIHNRGCTVSYEWDGDSCTAELICNNCRIVLESETASDLTPIMCDAPDCRTTGYYYYVADFENELFETQESEKTETVQGPHIYENYICKYCKTEDLITAKADATEIIDAAAGNSTDAAITSLVAAAKSFVNSTDTNTVAKVLEIRDYWVAAIEKLEHTYSLDWSYDENYHWHASTCGHIEVVNAFSAHTFDENGKCTVCGYEDTGIRAKVCTVILTSVDAPDTVLYSGTTDGTNICNIGNVANGTYLMSVSCEGAVTRTYTTEIADGKITQEVALYAEGDVNGDGEVDVNDYALAVNSALGSETRVAKDLTETADYQKAVADVDGDGFVDVLDVALLERKINI